MACQRCGTPAAEVSAALLRTPRQCLRRCTATSLTPEDGPGRCALALRDQRAHVIKVRTADGRMDLPQKARPAKSHHRWRRGSRSETRNHGSARFAVIGRRSF